MSDDSDNAIKTVAKGSVIFAAGLLFSYIASYIYRLIIARWLGPEDYGLLSIGFAIVSLVSGVVGLGLSEGVYRYVSYYRTIEKPEKIKGTFLTALRISLPVAIAAALIIFFFSKQISISIFHDVKLIPILKLFSITIPLLLLMSSYLQIARAFKKLQYEVFTQYFLENILKIAATIGLLILGFGFIGASFAYVLAVLVVTILAIYFVERKVYKLFFNKENAEYNFKEIWSYSMPLFFVSLLAPITSSIDSLFIGHYLGSAAVGYYNAALPTAQLAKFVFPALTALTIPILTEMLAKNKIEDLKKTYAVIARWVFISSLPIAAIIVLFSKQLLNLMFGKEYAIASVSMIILTVGYFVYAIMGPARATINALSKTKYTLINFIITLAISVGGCWFLIPRIGIIGAAIATGASFAMTNVLAWIELSHFINLQHFSKKWIKPTICAGISLAGFYLLLKYVIPSSTVTLIISGASFIISYFLLLLLSKSFEPEDKFILDIIRNRFKPR